jgi:hypothetical protein
MMQLLMLPGFTLNSINSSPPDTWLRQTFTRFDGALARRARYSVDLLVVDEPSFCAAEAALPIRKSRYLDYPIYGNPDRAALMRQGCATSLNANFFHAVDLAALELAGG